MESFSLPGLRQSNHSWCHCRGAERNDETQLWGLHCGLCDCLQFFDTYSGLAAETLPPTISFNQDQNFSVVPDGKLLFIATSAQLI